MDEQLSRAHPSELRHGAHKIEDVTRTLPSPSTPLPHVSDFAVGYGAVWAVSDKPSELVRLDPATGVRLGRTRSPETRRLGGTHPAAIFVSEMVLRPVLSLVLVCLAGALAAAVAPSDGRVASTDARLSDGVLELELPAGWVGTVEPGTVVIRGRPWSASWMLAGDYRALLSRSTSAEGMPTVPGGHVAVSLGDFPVRATTRGWPRVKRLRLPVARRRPLELTRRVRFLGRAVIVTVRFGSAPQQPQLERIDALLGDVRLVHSGDARSLGSVRLSLGRSQDGRAIVALRGGDPRGPRVLVVGCIHGTECAGIAIARALERVRARADLWIVPNLNPDGYARGTRQNGRGVDLNANWSSQWRGGGRPWDVYYPGPRPFSERETRIARNLILRIRPRVTIWFHQHMNLVWAFGPSTSAGRIYARAAGMRFYHHPWLHGTATNWQNHRLPGSASFTVELPAGSLTRPQVRAQVRAVLAVAVALPGGGA